MKSAAAEAAYRRTLAAVGQQATFVRVTGFAPHPVTTQSATVYVMASGIAPDGSAPGKTGYGAGSVGGISQNDRFLIALTRDLAEAGFPVPVKKNDKVIVQGEELNVTAVDINKREYAGAIEVTVAGV